MFTAFGTVISWKASLQKVVALSTTEAKYIALTETVKESLWLESITKEPKKQNKVITIHFESQSAIDLSRNYVHHERTKHIDIKLHFVREVIGQGSVIVKKISTDYNPSDMIINALPRSKFFHCLNLIQLKDD